jgi:hypothetical protein
MVEAVSPQQLAAGGRRFAERFASTQPGVPVQVSAFYAAQAAIFLPDAVARSLRWDARLGHRRTVRTRVTDGLVVADRDGRCRSETK